jgi:hypothetical protein
MLKVTTMTQAVFGCETDVLQPKYSFPSRDAAHPNADSQEESAALIPKLLFGKLIGF